MVRTSATSDVATFSPFHLQQKTTAGVKVHANTHEQKPESTTHLKVSPTRSWK